jgi:uncharacterized membrane protein
MSIPENPSASAAHDQATAGPAAPFRPTVERVPSFAEAMAPSGIVAGLPYGIRVLASAAYLSALGGFWLVVPAFVFLWKGRREQFLGFHALQAVFLQVATIPLVGIGLGLAYGLSSIFLVIGSEKLVPLAGFLFFAIGGLATTIPVAATVWMGMCALRGQPRELPVLGRWAKSVLRDV